MDHPNPYAAPTEPSAPAHPTARDSAPPAPLPLASRSARFAGAAIDTLLEWGFRWVMVDFATDGLTRRVHLWSWRLAFYGSAALVLGAQGVLVTRRGQSIGKMFTNTRIVRSGGSPAGFLRGFFVRTLPFTSFAWILVASASSFSAPELVTSLWLIVTTIDALLIFGARRRCGHDLLADTIVVQTGPHAGSPHDRVADPATPPPAAPSPHPLRRCTPRPPRAYSPDRRSRAP